VGVIDERGTPLDVDIGAVLEGPGGQRAGETVPLGQGTYLLRFGQAGSPGDHRIRAVLLGREISVSFSVVAHRDFDIVREFPLVIDPWKQEVRSTLRISAPAGRYALEDRMPDFTVMSTSPTTPDGTLQWEVEDGSTVEVIAQAPKVSPDVFEMGPARILSGTATMFTEDGPRYILSDPAASTDYFSPDMGAPGMNVVVTFIGTNYSGNDTVRTNSSDITVGPVVVTNVSGGKVQSGGRALTTVFFISPGAANQSVRVNISGTLISQNFTILTPAAQSGNFSGLSGTRTLGTGGANGTRSFGGTIVLDSLIIPAGMTVNVTTVDPDAALANGHQGYFAAVILVDGPVEIAGVLMVNGSDGTNGSGDTGGSAGSGGPGGGGGGAGGSDDADGVAGGDGFTGGGGSSADDQSDNGARGGNSTSEPGVPGTALGPGGRGGNFTLGTTVSATGGGGSTTTTTSTPTTTTTTESSPPPPTTTESTPPPPTP